MISKTTKIDYKLKKACFCNGNLINEDGEVIDLMRELYAVFKNECFDLSVSSTDKVDYTVDYFEKKDDEE